jgi:EAL domain-containing protein (putative c-di-GMP-specific phosphodiesterase class I)
MRSRQKLTVAALVLLLAVIALASFYFARFDLQWIAFLAGALFTAVVAAALMSRTGKVQWPDTRRDVETEPDTGPPAPEDAALPSTPDKTFGDMVVVSEEDGETVYLESMTEQLIGSGDPRDRLVQALQKDQFILFAQKMESVAPESGHGQCLEVLLRLQEEEEHLLPPGSFFPVAECYHLMGEIDRWVVRNLLKWCVARQRDNPDWLMPLCCVNLSCASLRDPEFPRYVQSELERSNIPGSGLCFEVTELDLIHHHHDAQALMSILRPLGCRFTVDGFVGSSEVLFAPFKDLKFDFLKIDGIIIQNILKERSALAKTKAIVLACQKIGVCTIAELVETEATIAQLREIGVDYMQGFGISRPAPLAQLV